MNEDQTLSVQDPAVIAPKAPEQVPPAQIAEANDFIQATHQVPAIAEELSGFVKPVGQPEHSLEGTDALQTPAKLASVDGSSVVIPFPDGFSSEADIQRAIKGKANVGERNAGQVWIRQRDRVA